ncbi:MAG: WYL domain-containing protein [Nitriliruptoraceae bacterium]
MSRATEDVARMLTLIPWLLERQGASLSEIATAFGVSELTIRRDLEHLDYCGLPGLGGGDLFEVDLIGDRVLVNMADELRRPLKPTASEALRLVVALDAVTEVLGADIPALRSAMGKVRDALGIPERLVDVLPSGQTPIVAQVRDAVTSQRQIELEYVGRGDRDPRRRRVDPWSLRLDDGVWYLYAYDHGAQGPRTFRCDRMVAIEIQDEIATTAPEETFEPPRYQRSTGDDYVVVEVDRNARWFIDAVEPETVEERSDGTAQVALWTDSLPWVARLVMMGCGSIEAAAPQQLRSMIVALAQAIADPAAPIKGDVAYTAATESKDA